MSDRAGDLYDLDAEFFAGAETVVCPACAAKNLPRARFCMDCGARMSVESGERRVVTVLFADLSGFTSYSETVDPEAVRAVAEETAHSLGRLVERYGGTVDKIIGDCVMAIFGAPVAHEDDPERAVRCALDMHAYVSEHAESFAHLQLSIGVLTGEAMYAPVGPSGSYTVLGDTVNTAARLQGAAAKGEVLIGEATARAVADSIEVEQIEPIAAKNKRNPVPAWRVAGLKGARRARVARKTPLIGRDLELNRLLERWEQMRVDRSPQLVSVVAGPGVGKTRLVQAFLERVEDQARVYRGRCLDYGEGITYWPVAEIIRDASGIHGDDASEVVSKKLGMLLESLGTEDLDELRTMAVAVANIVDSPTTPRGTYTAEKVSRAELHWGLRRIFELLARRRPVVIVVEDLHWAEQTLLELLDFFVHSDEAAPVLVLGTGRPELPEHHPAFVAPAPRKRSMTLSPLTDEQSEELLVELVGEAGRDALRALLRSAGGNPLFLEELVRMLEDEGLLDENGCPTARIDAVPIPANLQALIGSRLDRLPPREKQVAGNAAVVGDVFWPGAVSYVAEDDTDLSPALAALEEREVVRALPSSTLADQTEYAFRHAMIRTVAYERIPKAVRAQLHQRCGEWLSHVGGGDDDYIEFVAFHLERACRLIHEVGRSAGAPPVLAAVRALRRAGKKAMNRESVKEADRFYARALELVGQTFPETGVELTFDRFTTLWSLGKTQEALGCATSVVDTAAGVGRTDLRAQALVELAGTALAQGRAGDAGSFLEQAEEAAAAAGDVETKARAALVRAQFRASRDGDVTHAVEDLQTAIALADREHLDAIRFGGRLRLGTILLNMGDMEGADRVLDEAAALASEYGSVRSQALVHTFLAFTRFYRGPRDDAEVLASDAAGWFRRLSGHPYYLAQVLEALGLAALRRGDLAVARERLEEALAVARGVGGSVLAEAARHLVEVLCRQGALDEARTVVADVVERVPAEDRVSQAYTTLANAMILAGARDPEGIERFEQALAELEAMQMRLEWTFCSLSLAWGFTALRVPDRARALLQRAAAAAREMGADALLDDILVEIRRCG